MIIQSFALAILRGWLDGLGAPPNPPFFEHVLLPQLPPMNNGVAPSHRGCWEPGASGASPIPWRPRSGTVDIEDRWFKDGIGNIWKTWGKLTNIWGAWSIVYRKVIFDYQDKCLILCQYLPGISRWLLALEGICAEYWCSLHHGVDLGIAKSVCEVSFVGCPLSAYQHPLAIWGADTSLAETVAWRICCAIPASGQGLGSQNHKYIN